jgi:hypothetical protein
VQTILRRKMKITLNKIPFTHKIILFLVGIFLLWNIWLITPMHQNSRQPATTTMCIKYEPRTIQTTSNTNVKCTEYKTLKIPAIYFYRSGDAPTGNIEYGSNHFIIFVAYPSMRPWHSISNADSNKEQKIEIKLEGVTWATAKDRYNSPSYGDKPRVHFTDQFGMEKYKYEPLHFGYMYFYPREKSPTVLFQCGSSIEDGFSQEIHSKKMVGICEGYSYMTWRLNILYFFNREILHDWKDIDSSIHSLIESFVVTL